MSIATYDNPIQVSYRFAAASLTGAAAVLGRFQGPTGRTGRVLDLSYLLTTGVTVAASAVTIDTNAGITTPVSVAVPIAAINTGGSATKADVEAGTEFPADTVVEVQGAGGATAGAADINVTMGWF
jgi:hypothetical protein